MNDKVGKLVERVRLTDDEIFKIEQDFHKALRESGCFLEPHTVYRPGIKVYVEAQLNKVLNDPDLYLEITGEPIIKVDMGAGEESYSAVYYIPLAEAMKEGNNG